MVVLVKLCDKSNYNQQMLHILQNFRREICEIVLDGMWKNSWGKVGEGSRKFYVHAFELDITFCMLKTGWSCYHSSNSKWEICPSSVKVIVFCWSLPLFNVHCIAYLFEKPNLLESNHTWVIYNSPCKNIEVQNWYFCVPVMLLATWLSAVQNWYYHFFFSLWL